MTELIMDQRIVWNSSHLKQIDEAKKTYLKFKKLGYVITKIDGKVLERFIPSLEELIVKAQKTTKRVMKILNEMGDERLVWEKENGKQAKEAKAKFIKLLDDGYKAYSVDRGGNKNRRIEEFDIDAEEILMVPKTAKG